MKRYFCSILIFVLLFMFAFTPSASAVIYRSAGYESHGDWEDDPWEINSVSTFIKFRDDSNSYDNYKSLQKKYFKLTADLDLTSYSDWTAISWIWGDFSGTFDGNGHTIKVRISRNDATEVGLFGKISSGTVKNLHVIGNIKGYRSGEYDDAYVGGIVARLNNGTIENCTFDGTIEGKGGFEDTHVGGIAGYAGSGKVIIKNCRVGAYSATSIYGGVGYFGTNVGGIVGTLIMSDGSSVSNNFVRAEIEAEDQYSSYARAGNIYGSLGGGGNGISNNETIEPDAVEPEIEIETSALDDGYVGDAYAANLVSDIEGVKWSWLGNTPASVGLKLDSSLGLISGTPTAAGTFLFTVKAEKDGYVSKYADFKISILSETDKAVKITTTSLPSGTKGTSYVARLQANVSGVTWSWTGNTPENDGLTLNSSTGAITGKPVEIKTYNFSVVASKTDYISASKSFTIAITGLPTFAITTTTLEDAEVGEDYSAFFDAEVTGVTWSWSGNTPESAGLTLDSEGGYIYGTPTSGGRYTFTLTASKSGFADASVELTLLIAGGGIAISSTNFPDANFRSYVSGNKIDKDNDGYLSDSEIAAVKDIDVSSLGISNLKGIESFTALENLNCAGNSLTTLDITKNTALKFLDCSGNNLTALNISRNINLEFLDCSGNKLTALNTSSNKALENIHCYDNQLTSLNLSQNTNLEYLACQENKLTTLDVSNNTKLVGLYCNDNLLTELILGTNSVLEEIDCQNNSSLARLDIKGCSNLSKDNITYDSGLDIITDKGSETPDIEIIGDMPEFRGATLILEGQIGVNFYMSLPEGYDYSDSNKYYMEFDVKEGSSNKEPRQAYNPDFKIVSNGETLYGFRCYINSAQMAEKITANFHFNGTIISNDDSVDDYLNRVINKNYPEKTRNLMNAIRDYGHYAQLMLSKANGWTIGERYAEMPAATEYTDEDIAEARTNAAPYAVSVYRNSSGISRMGVSLNLDSETTLNVSFTPADNYNGSVSATVDGKAYDSNILNQDRRVQIENIPANDLGKMYTVMLEANGVNTVTASALSYVSIVFNQTGSSMGNVDIDTMKRAVTALYRYYAATRAYFGTGE